MNISGDNFLLDKCRFSLYCLSSLLRHCIRWADHNLIRVQISLLSAVTWLSASIIQWIFPISVEQFQFTQYWFFCPCQCPTSSPLGLISLNIQVLAVFMFYKLGWLWRFVLGLSGAYLTPFISPVCVLRLSMVGQGSRPRAFISIHRMVIENSLQPIAWLTHPNICIVFWSRTLLLLIAAN